MTGIQTTSNRRRKRTSKSPKIANIISLVRNIGYSSTPYRLLISGHIPQRISAKPSDLRTGEVVEDLDIDDTMEEKFLYRRLDKRRCYVIQPRETKNLAFHNQYIWIG